MKNFVDFDPTANPEAHNNKSSSDIFFLQYMYTNF